jgi:hypothetical protein
MEITKIPAFQKYFIDSDIYKSHVTLQGTPFLTILEMAKKGNIHARNYLFYISYPAINSVFFKNFIGKKSFLKSRIQQGDDYIFLAEAYIKMFKAEEFSPLAKFKPSSDKSEVYNINGFLYYVSQYLKKLAINLNTKDLVDKKQIMDINSESDSEANNFSYTKEDIMTLRSSVPLSSFTEESDIQMAFIKYLAILKNRPNKMEYNILFLKAKGYDTEYIAEKLKISKAWIYELIKKTKKEFMTLMGI